MQARLNSNPYNIHTWGYPEGSDMSIALYNEIKLLRAQLLEMLKRIEALEEKTAKLPSKKKEANVPA